MKKFLYVAALIVVVSAGLNAQIAVIANKSAAAGTTTGSGVADIYSLTTKEWKDGTPIVVFDLKTEGPARTKFYEFIGKSPVEIKKTWMRIQLSGEGKAPTGVGSDEEMLQKVASTPGAVGYISASKVTADVKVIATGN